MSTNNNANSRIKINDLLEKNAIEDSNLIIVEDAEDTKKTTVSELKKSFDGDGSEPSDKKFYTSKKMYKMEQDLKRDINTRADEKEIERIKSSINNIVASSGDSSKDTELVAARNGMDTLSKRLQFDIDFTESKYLQKIKRTVTGKKIQIYDHYGYVDLSIVKSDAKDSAKGANTLTVYSQNLLDYNEIIETAQVTRSKKDNGVIYTQGGNGYTIEIPLPVIYPAGKYTLLSNAIFSDNFIDKNIKLAIRYSDGTSEELPYNHDESFTFETRKGSDKLTIIYDPDNYERGAKVTFRNLMLVSYPYLPTTFIPYDRVVYNMSVGDNKFDFYNKNYVYDCSIQDGEVSISYYDNDTTIEYLYNELSNIKGILEDKTDHCGMIEDYGVYQFLDDMYAYSYSDGIVIEDGEEKYDRNGVHSKKITIAENATRNSVLRISISNPVDFMTSAGIFFYMEKPDWSLFSYKNGGIKIRLCSDDANVPSETNYYEYLINKDEMVQGWNFVKKRVSDFSIYGDPDQTSIKFISVEICRNDEMNNRSLYINSFVFNQKMKPTVILCFDGTYDESISYLYPYLNTRGIKPTIFLNQKRTLTNEAIDGILKYKLTCDWDIGLDSCHPNKEILIQDDNYRNQFAGITNSHNWLVDTVTSAPISYSAAYGNLRPITIPIIKDLGYKIVKTSAEGYCGFFSDKDLCVPMSLISNNIEADEIKEKIDYAIKSGQAIILYTNNVTEYGSEIDAKKVTLESIVDYIQDRVKAGAIECMTLKGFYNKCVN